jgi:hypothetical protein
MDINIRGTVVVLGTITLAGGHSIAGLAHSLPRFETPHVHQETEQPLNKTRYQNVVTATSASTG